MVFQLLNSIVPVTLSFQKLLFQRRLQIQLLSSIVPVPLNFRKLLLQRRKFLFQRRICLLQLLKLGMRCGGWFRGVNLTWQTLARPQLFLNAEQVSILFVHPLLPSIIVPLLLVAQIVELSLCGIQIALQVVGNDPRGYSFSPHGCAVRPFLLQLLFQFPHPVVVDTTCRAVRLIRKWTESTRGGA